MKKRTLWATILCLLSGLQFLNAQTTDPSDSTLISETGSTTSGFNTNYPPFETGFYIGARGGYVLKNKSLYENPLYFLGIGMFAELNGGWRKKSFGWDLSLGMLNIKRDAAKTNSRLNVEEVLRNTQYAPSNMKDTRLTEIINSGKAKDAYFTFNDATAISEKKDLNGYYALTGPRLWLGSGKLQVSISVQGGVISRNFGYYYSANSGVSTNNFVYATADPKGEDITTTLQVNGAMSEYGGPKEAFNASGTKDDPNNPEAYQPFNEKRKMAFIGRGGLGLEYFVAPTVSLSLGADYWYTSSPEMTGVNQYTGTLYGSTSSLGVENTRINARYSNSKTYSEKKNLGVLSASLGVKIWLGKQKEKPAPPPVAVASAPIQAERSLVVKVIDKPTGQPLAGVSVTIAKTGSDDIIQTMTMEDGTIPLLKGIDPANYTITGAKNGVAATSASVSANDFNKAATVYRELVHNDLRFTLAGKTINKEAQTGLPFIQTSLTNISKGTADQRTSDSTGKFNYQLEQNTDYNVIAQNKGYFSNKEKVTTRGLNRSEVIYVNLALEVVELKKDASIVLKDIYYDYNSATIRPDAALVLDNLVKMLQENPAVNIELSSHTDSRGGDAFNLDLSRKRASAAVRYLISKGIGSKRLTAKGYGETRLLNNCGNDANCTEEEHQLNRRTEIKILE